MLPSLAVAVGGAIGSLARYWTTLLATRAWGDQFPWGTVLINVFGSFIIGYFATATEPGAQAEVTPNLRLFVMTGICGGYTTFSAFSLQTLSLLRTGDWPEAAANVAGSVVLCLAAVTLGHFLAQR